MKKFTLTAFGTSFNFSIFGLILYFSLLTVLCSLGNWQLRRATEKEQYLRQQVLAGKAESIDLNAYVRPGLNSLEYRHVTVTGHYDVDHQFLIDNQVNKGRAGYFVMTPLIIDGQDQAVLVNRGWVPMALDRSVKTDIKIATSDVTIDGRVNHFPSVGLVLEGADIPSESWPAVVQVVNPDVLTKKLGYPLLDFQVELSSAMTEGYLREWREIAIMPPEKHVAYAVQWFGLAATLTVLFIWLSYKKNNE